VVVLHGALLALLALLPLLAPPGGPPADELFDLAEALLLGLVGWCFLSWWLVAGTLLDFYSLFLLAASLFNGGQVFLDLFHVGRGDATIGASQSFRALGVSDRVLLETVYLVTLSLATLHFGALLGALCAASPGALPAALRPQPFQTADLRRVGYGLMLVAAPFVLHDLGGRVAAVIRGGYLALFPPPDELEYGLEASAVGILAALFLPGSLLVLASCGRPGGTARAVAWALVAYSAVQLSLGSRYLGSVNFLALAWVWHCRIRPLPWRAVAPAGAALMFVVFPTLAVVRAATMEDRLSPALLWDMYFSIDNPVVAIVAELGGTMRTVAYTINLVPAERDYELGRHYLISCSVILPNVFGGAHPAHAYAFPSNWVTEATDPAVYESGGSIAYSFIAETYLNFGWAGPLVLVPFGFLYAYAVSSAQRSRDAAWVALVATAGSAVVFWARQECLGWVRQLTWYSIGPYVLLHLSALLRAVRRPPPAPRPAGGGGKAGKSGPRPLPSPGQRR
jgi:hypothetical protein